MSPAPPYPPEAVVFDLDGLLVDSEDAWARATRQVVEDLGGVWEDALHTLLLGSGPAEAARLLAAHLGGRHAPADIAASMRGAAAAAFARGFEPRPGAVELVKALHGQLPLAVATNSERALADRALSSSGLAGWFATVVCADDVVAPKPAPDPYTMACAGCGARPERSVALEDSPAGTRSAKAAGLWVIGCPSLPGVTLPAADVVVASLTAVDPDLLAQPGRGVGSRGSRDRPT
ncbi:MAG TPA: HAD family phosphatase [Egibacteraceae bacterium]|nr:HAD family phosphatase [Egibacteraceae bacterium]